MTKQEIEKNTKWVSINCRDLPADERPGPRPKWAEPDWLHYVPKTIARICKWNYIKTEADLRSLYTTGSLHKFRGFGKKAEAELCQFLEIEGPFVLCQCCGQVTNRKDYPLKKP